MEQSESREMECQIKNSHEFTWNSFLWHSIPRDCDNQFLTVFEKIKSDFCHFEYKNHRNKLKILFFCSQLLNKMGLRFLTKSQIKGTLVDFKGSAKLHPKLWFQCSVSLIYFVSRLPLMHFRFWDTDRI